MKSFEPVYKELETLFIEKLPEYIEKVNKEHNDGIILKPFKNTMLEENCLDLPSFKLAFEQAEYEEKDRIIENTVYEISLEIKLHTNTEKQTIILWRYIEAINRLLNESDNNHIYTIIKIKEKKLFIKITLCL